MGYGQWEGGVALVRASSAIDAPTTGYKYPAAETAEITKTPLTSERILGFIPDVDILEVEAFDYGFSVPNISPNANMFGYLAAIALGSHSWLAGVISITPSDDVQYLNALVDYVQDLGTNTPTERLLGAKIGTFSLECQQDQIAKLTIGGVGCDLGVQAASLTMAFPTGANEAPLSWKALRAGYFKVGLNAVPTAQDDDITGMKIDWTRNLTPTGRTLGHVQPSRIVPGIRNVFFEFEKEFSGDSAKAQYAAFLAGQLFQMELKFLMGTYYVTSGVLSGKAVEGYPQQVGAGEDTIKARVRCKAQRYGGVALLTFDVKDGSTAVYWA